MRSAGSNACGARHAGRPFNVDVEPRMTFSLLRPLVCVYQFVVIAHHDVRIGLVVLRAP